MNLPSDSELKAHPCDVCGSSDAVAIPAVRHYTEGQDLYTCKSCGFVFAHMRRDDDAILKTWADEMFRGTFEVEDAAGDKPVSYTGRVPAVIARLTYAMEFIDVEIGLENKAVCDVGAGEGQFLEMLRGKPVAGLFGVEPSADNCRTLRSLDFPCFNGGVEEFAASRSADAQRFDIVTANWTVENTPDIRRFFETVHALLPVGGHFAVATGSRILVPFKKPLHYYFNPRNPVDLHAFHCSFNALCGLMAATGFEPIAHNRYIDTDYLCVIGRKRATPKTDNVARDDHRAVIDFFERWKTETEAHYRQF